MKLCKRCGKVKVAPKRTYCAGCAKLNQRERSNAWYRSHPETRAKKLPQPEKTGTSLQFLDEINRYLRAATAAGLSYGQYRGKSDG